MVTLPSTPPVAVERSRYSRVLVAPSVIRSVSVARTAAFGGTVGSGYWADMQYFLAHPTDIQGTAQKLEADAAKVTWN